MLNCFILHFAAEEAVISEFNQTDQYTKFERLYVRRIARTNVHIITRLVCLKLVSL